MNTTYRVKHIQKGPTLFANMQQPDGTILVTGQKFYPKEDDGRGAAWRNVWLTPDGKIVRKGEITLRGG